MGVPLIPHAPRICLCVSSTIMEAEIATTGDAPFLRFPPWPAPPPGVSLISFVDFQPVGIQLKAEILIPEAGGSGDVEYDGLGIPTVRLKVKHVITDDIEKKKKKKKKKGGAAAASMDGQRLGWWEQWQEAEALKPTVGSYPL
jgi:hypothetical protein